MQDNHFLLRLHDENLIVQSERHVFVLYEHVFVLEHGDTLSLDQTLMVSLYKMKPLLFHRTIMFCSHNSYPLIVW